jgi:hypothetical protein
MEIRLECKYGHAMEYTSWIDADGDLRLIVRPCENCGDEHDDSVFRMLTADDE